MNRLDLARWIDRYVGNVFCLLLGLFVRQKSLHCLHPKSILVVRLWTIGESLLTLPMIQHLQQNFPDATIDVLVTRSSAAVFKGHSFVHEFLFFSSKSFLSLLRKVRHYDLVIDAEPYFRLSALLAFWLGKRRLGFDHGVRARLYHAHGHYLKKEHVVYSFFTFLKAFGLQKQPSHLVELLFSAKDVEHVQAKIQTAAAQRPVIGIYSNASPSLRERAWPADYFVALIDRLTAQGFFIVLTGQGDYDRSCNEAIRGRVASSEHVVNWANELSFGEFCAFLKEVRFYVANDGGPLHVAAAQGATVVGFFGAETPERYGPFPLYRHLVFYKNAAIGPCVQPWLGKTLDCTRQIQALHRITPEEVYDAMMHRLQSKKR